jgi:N-acetyl-anhydromuramyl-L-alanine amidase AmpD
VQAMPIVNEKGEVKSARVRVDISGNLENGPLTYIRGIIIHQTGAPTAESTINTYRKKRTDSKKTSGAHFLIDKDGSIIQTASLLEKTQHVGPVKARCLVKKTCTPVENNLYKQKWKSSGPRITHDSEMKKKWPDRYPSNSDSIGIELVGQAFESDKKNAGDPIYEAPTDAQNESLRWLVFTLRSKLELPIDVNVDVLRHPEVSRKNDTEAAGAKWER